MIRNRWLSVLLSSVLCPVVGCAAAVDDPPASDVDPTGVELTLEETEAGSGKLTYTLTNHAAEPVRVLRQKTPFVPMADPLLEVHREGKRVMYLGPIARRGSPTDADYLELAPGETKTTELDLTRLYDLRGGGALQVRSIVEAEQLLRDPDRIPLRVSEPLEIEIASPGGAGGVLEVEAQAQAIQLSECNPHRSLLVAAIQEEALFNARLAADDFRQDPTSELSIRWFGSPIPDFHPTIQRRLDDIHSWFASDQIVYSCNGSDMGPNVWAYVFQWLPGYMFLTPRFFQGPLGDQIVTVIHETAHFTGAVDFATAPAVLAQTAPWNAIENAENYARYVLAL